MIDFVYNTDFQIENHRDFSRWLMEVAAAENCLIHDLVFLFVSDQELLAMNKRFLKHNHFTDVITFGELEGDKISGNIAISVDRVLDNSKTYGVGFDEELKRVMAHGLLHIIGYNDKTKKEKLTMSQKETDALKMFHVKQA